MSVTGYLLVTTDASPGLTLCGHLIRCVGSEAWRRLRHTQAQEPERGNGLRLLSHRLPGRGQKNITRRSILSFACCCVIHVHLELQISLDIYANSNEVHTLWSLSLFNIQPMTLILNYWEEERALVSRIYLLRFLLLMPELKIYESFCNFLYDWQNVRLINDLFGQQF